MENKNKNSERWNKDEIVRMNNMFFANCLTAYPEQKNHYICPVCGGHNLKLFKTKNDKWRVTCWNNKCGSANGHLSMDAIDYISEARRCGKNEALDALKIICNSLETNSPINVKLEPEGDRKKIPVKKNKEKYYQVCRKKLVDEFNYIETRGRTRGISLETFKRYGVGFDFSHRTATQKTSGGYTPAFIFPVNSTAYTHIDSRTPEEIERDGKHDPKKIEDIRNHRKGKVGSPATSFNLMIMDLDNIPDYLFIVEGGFDLLSAAEAGIENIISLESANNYDHFIAEIERLREGNNGQLDTLLIPFLDTDETGNDSQERLVKELTERGFNFANVDRTLEGCKDMNEYLTTHGVEALRNYLQNILDQYVKTQETAPQQENQEQETKDTTPQKEELPDRVSAAAYFEHNRYSFREAYKPIDREDITKGEQEVQFNMTKDFNVLDEILYQSYPEPEKVVNEVIEDLIASEGLEGFREKHPALALIRDYGLLIKEG